MPKTRITITCETDIERQIEDHRSIRKYIEDNVEQWIRQATMFASSGDLHLRNFVVENIEPIP